MYIWDIIYIYIIHGKSLVRGCKPVPTTGMLTEIAQVAYNSLLHSLRQCGKLGTMTEPSMVQAQPMRWINVGYGLWP